MNNCDKTGKSDKSWSIKNKQRSKQAYYLNRDKQTNTLYDLYVKGFKNPMTVKKMLDAKPLVLAEYGSVKKLRQALLVFWHMSYHDSNDECLIPDSLHFDLTSNRKLKCLDAVEKETKIVPEVKNLQVPRF
jgi:hypothetical protein